MMLSDSREEVVSLIASWHDMIDLATPNEIGAALSYLVAEHLAGVGPADREDYRTAFNQVVDEQIPRIDEAIHRLAPHLIRRAN
jgi:hypothetical protein